MDSSEGDEFKVTDQEPADDTPEAEDARLAQAIAEGLTTEPVSKQRVLEELQTPTSESP